MTDKITAQTHNLRKCAEEKLGVHASPASFSEDPQKLLHELQVYKIELEIQNEELSRTIDGMREHEEYLSDLIKKSPAGYFSLSNEGYFLDVNDAWLRMHGYDTPDEVIGKHFSITFVDFFSDKTHEHLANLLRGEVIPAGEYSSLRKDGSIGYHIFSAHPVVRSNKTVRLEWSIMDITKRKQAEEALRESRTMLSLVLNTVPQSIFWKDLEGRYLGCNRLFAAAAGLDDPARIVGKTDFDLPWPVKEAEAYRADDQEVLQNNHPKLHIIERLQQADGTSLWVDTSKVPLQNASGQAFAVLGVYDDITARVHAEEQLKKSELSKTALLESFNQAQAVAMIGSWEWDLKTNHVWWSEETYRIFGVTPQDFVPDFEANSAFIHPDDLERYRRAFEHSLQTGEPVDMHIRLVVSGGLIKHCNAKGKVFNDDSGQASKIVGTIMDITESKKVEEEKANLELQLLQAQKLESVGRLAGGVAHDFNNMLTVIHGHAELGLMRLGPTHPVCRNLKEIKDSAERSADLTRQLLAFARKQTVAPKVIDLNDTISGMLKMLQRLIGEGIQLIWQPAPDICLVKVDPSQIDQILANLCVNARDAIEDIGRITIDTSNCSVDADYCAAIPEATPGEYVRLTVSDDGRGMDKETISHIFEPFYTTKELGKGTGLGLATVYGAVRQNNGFINVYSEPEQGTTFSIYLPHHEAAIDQAHTEVDVLPIPRGQETILLVEDEAAILNITALMLENQGYTVLKAATPGGAMQLAREHSGGIHLLMTDVIMPEMNGRDLANNLLSICPDVKCLFMSGYTADIIAHHGVLDDGVYFIQKPFSLPNMAAKVREVLDSI